MAIFESSLEKIRFINKLNNKDIKTNLIQITNYQNDIGDETFLDLKFELNVIHKCQFLQTKKFLNQNNDSPAFKNNDSVRKIVSLFKKQNTKHKEIFNNIERIVSQVYADDTLFINNRTKDIYTDFFDESKKYVFDLLSNFISSYKGVLSIPTTKKLANDLFKDYENNENENLLNLKNKFIENNLNLNSVISNNQVLTFLKNFMGFNFLNIDNIENSFKISNGNKPLSLMSINTAKNNIKNNAFDDMSINTLLYGFISNEELLKNKYNYSDLTNFPLIEDDITKEFIPFKYTKNFNLFKNSNIRSFTKDYISIISQTSLKNENESEFLNKSISSFYNIKNCIYSNNITENNNFTYTTKINENLKFESKTNSNLLAHTKLYKILNPKTYGITSLLQKDKSDILQCLNLIANNISSKRVILLKNAISTSSNFNNNLFQNLERPNQQFVNKIADSLAFHNSINNEELGILNNTLSIFNEKNSNFFANILKNRNMCNDIVKKFKKIYYKNTDFYNKFQNTFSYSKIDFNELNSFNSYLISNLENKNIPGTSINDIRNKFKNKSTIDVAELKEYNGYIIGDQNIDSNKNLNEILTNQYNENINFENIKNAINNEKENIKTIINEYYSEDLDIFKNTSTFFSSIKDICSENISFLTNNNANVDILDTASILWCFNESNTIYTQTQKDEFLNKLSKNLIKFNIIMKSNNNNLKNTFKTEIDNLISGYNISNNIMELFPFFIFTTEDFTNDYQKNFFNTHSFFNSTREYETNGLFSHFIYDENNPFNLNKLNDIKYFEKNKLTDINENLLKKINIAGYHDMSYDNVSQKIMFVPEIFINQNKNYEIKNNIFVIPDIIPNQYSYLNYSYSIVLKELQTKYSLLKTFNFNNNDINNNLFFNILSRFNILIDDILIANQNINTITNNDLENIIDNNNEILSIVKNTLKITSDIYCDMSNSLQSYINIANRIFQSNELNAKIKINIQTNVQDNNNNDIVMDSPYIKKAYNLMTNINSVFWNADDFNIIKNDDSFCFSTVKFYYLLTKVFNIDIMTTQTIINHACSQNIKIDEDTIKYDTLKNIRRNSNFNTNDNILDNFPGYDIFVNNSNTNMGTTYNVFDIFNIYNKKMSDMISGFFTYEHKKEYEFLLTSPTMINYIINSYKGDGFPTNYDSNIQKEIIPNETVTYFKIRDKKITNNQQERQVFFTADHYYQVVENNESYIANKSDPIIIPVINNNVIFENLVNNSFTLNDNYKIYSNAVDINDINQIKKSTGLNEYYSHTYPNKYLNISFLPSFLPSFQQFSQNHPLIYKKYIDISKNWYNHIYQGLIVNDISLSMSFDFLNFYYDQYLNIINTTYNILDNSRKRLINNLNIDSTFAFLKNKIGEVNTKKILNFNKNNQLLQDSYEKAIIKYKSSKNIIDLIWNTGLLDSVIINENVSLISNIFKQMNDINNGNGEIIYSYLNDFYINSKQKKIENNTSNIIDSELNQLHAGRNANFVIHNQAKELLGSHILSIGIDNNINLDKNDIIVIQVELIDHDFPEIVWEPKIFEYYSSFDDINNSFIQNLNLDDNNLQIKIKNSWLNDLIDNDNLKDKIIKNTSYTYDNSLNLTNNIFSKTYNNHKSVLNPIDYKNINSIDIDILKDKIFDDFIKQVLEDDEFNKMNSDILKRCKHNQLINFKLKKALKLISGIDIDLFNENIDFNKKLILKDVYDIFVTNALQNNSFENYEINYSDFIKTIDTTEKIIHDYIFYTGSLSNENKINIFIKFLSDFSKAIIEDFCFMENGNNLFQKIYNIAVNSKDFIVAGLEGERNIIPSNPDLIFEKILNNEQNIFVDEIGTEPNFILRMLSKYTISRDDITYFKVKNKKNNSTYIPKNVSYRITTKILK